MTWTIPYEFDGFEFSLTFGSIYIDGVNVHPSTAELDNPDYIKALKKACEFHPVASAYYIVKDYTYNGSYDISRSEIDFLERMLNNRDIILQAQYPELVIDTTMAHFFADCETRLSYLIQQQRKKEMQQNRKKVLRPGFVYLIQSPTGAFKIGRTKDPNNRMKTFGIALPFEVEYLCLISTQNMNSLESKLHKKYADKRINGEWFNLSSEDVEYIKSLAVQS